MFTCAKRYDAHAPAIKSSAWPRGVWPERVVTTCPQVFTVWSDNTWCKELTSLRLESVIYTLSHSAFYQPALEKGKTTHQGQSSSRRVHQYGMSNTELHPDKLCVAHYVHHITKYPFQETKLQQWHKEADHDFDIEQMNIHFFVSVSICKIDTHSQTKDLYTPLLSSPFVHHVQHHEWTDDTLTSLSWQMNAFPRCNISINADQSWSR